MKHLNEWFVIPSPQSLKENSLAKGKAKKPGRSHKQEKKKAVKDPAFKSK